jgi:hypothetical protein
MPQNLSLTEVCLLFCAGYACGMSVSIGPHIAAAIKQAASPSGRLLWKSVALFTSVVCGLGVGFVFIFMTMVVDDGRTVQRVVAFGVALLIGMSLATYLPIRNQKGSGAGPLSVAD